MSSSRAQANHRLYLSKILLASWRRALAAQDIPALTLCQAFLPAVREHLLQAYGWFLVEVTGTESPSGMPPRSCGQLPDVAEGKAVSGEIREFQQLETTGWLAQLLAPENMAVQGSRTSGNLATAAAVLPDIEQVELWVNRLETLFDRMSDSLDEY